MLKEYKISKLTDAGLCNSLYYLILLFKYVLLI